MAEWVSNRVNFMFYRETDYKEFKEFVKSKTLDFDLREIVKPPQDTELLSNWYENNWGCGDRLDGSMASIKDNFQIIDYGMTRYGYIFYVNFRTAWTPPVEVYKKLKRLFFGKESLNRVKWHYAYDYDFNKYGYLENE